MDEALLAAYRNTAYLVCVDAVQWPRIHIDEPLPATLQALVDTRPWGFITAWNPRSRARSVAANRAAQRDLLAALHEQPDLAALHPGIGVGSNGWYEPSLFVIGPRLPALDALCRAHAQNAYVYGCGHGPAQLRVLGD